MAKNIDRIAAGLGAKVVGKLPHTGRGAFGAARLASKWVSLSKGSQRGQPSKGSAFVFHWGQPLFLVCRRHRRRIRSNSRQRGQTFKGVIKGVSLSKWGISPCFWVCQRGQPLFLVCRRHRRRIRSNSRANPGEDRNRASTRRVRLGTLSARDRPKRAARARSGSSAWRRQSHAATARARCESPRRARSSGSSP